MARKMVAAGLTGEDNHLESSQDAFRALVSGADIRDECRAGGHGATAGAFRAIGDLGSTLGPVLATAMIGFGFRSFFLVNAALVLIAILIFWRWATSRPGGAAVVPVPA